MNIYEIVERYLGEGKTGIIATVIQRLGSAPRDIGAKMFIGEDRQCYGTVGGGRLEADVFEEALRLMGKGEVKLFHVSMDAKVVAEDGMLCGGNVNVLLEPVDIKYKELYTKLHQLEKKAKGGVVITRFGEGVFFKTLIDYKMEVSGDTLSDDEIKRFQTYLNEKKPLVIGDMVIEPLNVYSVLYIFGAGHVSQFISRVAKIVDFYVVVIDDRDDFANRERFPDADEIIIDDFTNVFNKLKFSGDEYSVIVTRGHQFDAFVLSEVLRKPFRYVGMIGSRRKVKIVFDNMREKGISDDVIKRVHAPIGIDINAETPQEIAVSIVAELIQERGAD